MKRARPAAPPGVISQMRALVSSVVDPKDPSLLGWTVDLYGKWSVYMLIDGEVVAVQGYAYRVPMADLPPGSP